MEKVNLEGSFFVTFNRLCPSRNPDQQIRTVISLVNYPPLAGSWKCVKVQLVETTAVSCKYDGIDSEGL